MIRTELVTSGLYLRSAVILAVGAGVMFSCTDSLTPDRTFFGPSTPLASGTAKTYVTLDRSGNPGELGIALTEATLTGLPTTSREFVMALPEEASATAYKHAVVNWWVSGHGPMGSVYAVPHFDVHYYMVTQAEREAMVLGSAELSAKMVRQPAAEFIPLGYVASMAVPQMGMHWINPAAPEQNGQPFTHTFFYGSYDGRFMLNEPMVTKAYLETKPARVVTPITMPAQFATPGYHPTSYTVEYDAGTKEYRIALSGLVLR